MSDADAVDLDALSKTECSQQLKGTRSYYCEHVPEIGFSRSSLFLPQHKHTLSAPRRLTGAQCARFSQTGMATQNDGA